MTLEGDFMRSTSIAAALVLMVCPITVSGGSPQTTATMKISGMPGQFVVLADQVDWSQIEGLPDPTAPRADQSSNPLITRSGSALASRGGTLGDGRGSVALQDISIVKEIDKATPKIADACMSGEVFPEVEIDVVSTFSGETEYLRVTLENVVVQNFQPSSSSGSDRPTETVTLGYSKASWEYLPTKQIQRATPSFYPSTPYPK
jgi:type VI secretion system Hcp family effector